MAEELTTKKPATFSDAMSAELVRVHEALPKGFNQTRFVQNAISLLNEHPELQKYNQSSIKAGLLKGAYLGLDFYSKECYLIPYGNSLNFMIDYRGSKKLAKKYSIRPIRDIDAKIVREGDVFETETVDGNDKFTFKPKAFSDAPIVGAFAYVVFMDGGTSVEVMSKAEIEKTRSHSRAKNAMAWSDFYEEMAKKTVIHRICKHIEIELENPHQQEIVNEDNNTLDNEKSDYKPHDVYANPEPQDTVEVDAVPVEE